METTAARQLLPAVTGKGETVIRQAREWHERLEPTRERVRPADVAGRPLYAPTTWLWPWPSSATRRSARPAVS